jgi:hypothetical protein
MEMLDSNGATVGAGALVASPPPPCIPYPCRLLSHFVSLSLSIYLSTYMYLSSPAHTGTHSHALHPQQQKHQQQQQEHHHLSLVLSFYLFVYLSMYL